MHLEKDANEPDMQRIEEEFTQWMREPEQYRALMCDRLNTMFAYIRTLEEKRDRLQNRVAQLGNLCGKCPICKARIADSVHHLVPRELGGAKDDRSMWGKRKVTICRACHDAIHELATNEMLATKYRSIDLICNDSSFRQAIRSKADSLILKA